MDGWREERMSSQTVPHTHKFPSGVFDKLLITICGRIKENADKSVRTSRPLTVSMGDNRDQSSVLWQDHCGHVHRQLRRGLPLQPSLQRERL